MSMNTVPETTGGARAASRRAALIASARKHFVQKGFEATSLDDLIADAGGSRRNIYDLFGGKEGILSAVIEQIIGEIAQSAEIPSGTDTEPRDCVGGAVGRYAVVG